MFLPFPHFISKTRSVERDLIDDTSSMFVSNPEIFVKWILTDKTVYIR